MSTIPRRWWGRAPARLCEERGSAVIEFGFLTVLVLVPLVYLVLLLARIQAGSYAVTLASREAGRAFVTAPAGADAAARAEAAARLAFDDQGFGGHGTIMLSCGASPCLTPEAEVSVTAAVSVPVPLVPGFLVDAVPLSVPVTTTYVGTVDRFREAT